MNRMGLAALAVLMLAGCTTAPNEPADGGLSGFLEARDEMVALLDQLEAVVPGEWTQAEFGARRCDLPAGGTGAHAIFQRLGPAGGAGAERETAEQMSAVLAEAGYETTMSEGPIEGGVIIRGGYPASGTDENGIGVRFGVSPNGSTLDATTRCVPGDPAEINEQR